MVTKERKRATIKKLGRRKNLIFARLVSKMAIITHSMGL